MTHFFWAPFRVTVKGRVKTEKDHSPHTMKTEDSVNQNLNEAGALHCMSGSNYGGKGKRIKVLSHPGVPLVGLMLLATLPFGASIKQSVPRVKLSHRGKNWNIVDVSVNFVVDTYLYLLWFKKKKKVWVIWDHFGYFISCQQPSSSVHVHIAGVLTKATCKICWPSLLWFLWFFF